MLVILTTVCKIITRFILFSKKILYESINFVSEFL